MYGTHIILTIILQCSTYVHKGGRRGTFGRGTFRHESIRHETFCHFNQQLTAPGGLG